MFKEKPDCPMPANTVVLKLDPRIGNLIKNYTIPAGTNKKVILRKVLSRIEEGNTKQRELGKIFFLSPVYRIAISTAASLLLIFLLHFFIAKTHISVSDIHPKSHLFPDNSKIIQSYNSYINFPKYWWKREVTLQGNAYFEVNKGKPFKVITNYGNIEVIGTRFFIDQQNNGLKIECFEGSIKFVTKANVEHLVTAGHSMIIKDNQIIEILPTEKTVPEITNFNQYFSQVSVKSVAEEIEYFFQISVELQDLNLKNHYSGRIYTSNPDSALMTLCSALDLNLRFTPSKNSYIIQSNN